MTTFLKIGVWTFNLDAITRFHDAMPEKNMIEIESTTMAEGPIQFWNAHADAIRRHFANASSFAIEVVDLESEPPPRKTWDGVTMKEKHDSQNSVPVHQDMVAMQATQLADLRWKLAEAQRTNEAETRENARLRKAYERVNKANVGLVNQLIDVDCAARKLINGAEWIMGSSLESVQTADLIALRTSIGELRADRHLEYEGANE